MFDIRKTAIINGGKESAIVKQIRETLEINGVSVVRLEITEKECDANNIYGLQNGAIIWQVQDMREYNPKMKDTILALHFSYSGIDIYPKNKDLVLGTSVDGFRFLIDPTSGKIVGEESWVK